MANTFTRWPILENLNTRKPENLSVISVQSVQSVQSAFYQTKRQEKRGHKEKRFYNTEEKRERVIEN